MKKRLTQNEEFEILKLVLDKFLWLGFGVMAFGLYNMFTNEFWKGAAFLGAGAIILILFMLIITRNYEITE